MPVYEFTCDHCGDTKEVIATMAEGPGDPPMCCQRRMRRIFSCAGFVLKGAGWPSKAIKRQGEDSNIQRQRRKASVLKEQGDIPWEATIHAKDADKEFDKRYADKDLDNLYHGTVEEG